MYLPEYSIGAEGLGLDYVPESINVFLYVKHRQRHGTSEPYRRMGKVYAWTCEPSNADKADQCSPPREATAVRWERIQNQNRQPTHPPGPNRTHEVQDAKG